MKQILLFLFCTCLAYTVFAQDVIIKRNGDEINALVKEITAQEIKYKRFDNPEGPLISIAKSDVFMIKYQNGTSEVITAKAIATYPPEEVHPAQPQDYLGVITPVNLSGPRLGFTYIAPGSTANKLKDNFDAEPFMTLFGWQFEKQFFTLPSGTTGVFEVIPVIVGFEQGLFLPSGSFLFGMRGPNGMEFGMGPNLSLTGFAMVFAAGVNLRTSEINFPINFAVVASPGGMRLSLVAGFNVRRY
jgi:hypothetical protein